MTNTIYAIEHLFNHPSFGKTTRGEMAAVYNSARIGEFCDQDVFRLTRHLKELRYRRQDMSLVLTCLSAIDHALAELARARNMRIIVDDKFIENDLLHMVEKNPVILEMKRDAMSIMKMLIDEVARLTDTRFNRTVMVYQPFVWASNNGLLLPERIQNHLAHSRLAGQLTPYQV